MNRRILAPLLVALLAALWAGCSSDGEECSAGQTACKGTCVNLQTNAGNCGACGNACDAGLVCHEGDCVCPQGMNLCDGVCVDTKTNAQHCGGCGVACLGETPCVNGFCGCDGDDCGCQGLLCGEEQVCVDSKADPLNCGACGNVCGKAQHCVSGTCSMGDLFVACKETGTISPFLKRSLQESGFTIGDIGGPSSMALFGEEYLLIAGAHDGLLRVIDRTTMVEVASIATGAEPNHIAVRGDRAYVITRGDHAIYVVDLSSPENPQLAFKYTNNNVLGGTRPTAAAFLRVEDLDRTLWITLASKDQLIPVTMADHSGWPGGAVNIPAGILEGKPTPTGIVTIGVDVYASLSNMAYDGKGPAGNSMLFRYRRGLVKGDLFDLGEDCKNAGHLAEDGDRVYVACRGSGKDDGAVVIFNPALARPFSLEEEPPEVDPALEVIPLGGAPERLALDPSRPGWIYVADASGNELAVISPERKVERVPACPAVAGEALADVVVVP